MTEERDCDCTAACYYEQMYKECKKELEDCRARLQEVMTLETCNLSGIKSSTPIRSSQAISTSPILGGNATKRRVARKLEKEFDNPSNLNELPARNPGVGEKVLGKKRQALRGFTCKTCAPFYKALSFEEDDVDKVSRHRAVRSPVRTPEGFWDPCLPSTEFMLEKQRAPVD